ncbi:hypothetical protein SAMN05443252_101556 [Bacillus sp. OV322]|nr:hypothetical protein SAMN05443252_101556 [Bacillus sp. OV322]
MEAGVIINNYSLSKIVLIDGKNVLVYNEFCAEKMRIYYRILI